MNSGDTNKLIDSEIRALGEGAYARATEVLKTQEAKLHLLAQALLEYETLNGEEIDELLANGKLDRASTPKGPTNLPPVRGSAIPKAGKRFGGSGEAPQGA
jgi:cell division protease FtsH